VAQLPSGTVTFLFTDVEGSTRLLQELGDQYAGVLAEHRRVLRDAFERHGGVEVDTQGDAFFIAFAKASDALAAAGDARDALAAGPIRVRIGLHTGEPLLTDEGYVGIDVHRAARIAAAGHGGQILVSQSTRELAPGDGLRDLGEHRLKDLAAPERIYQLGDGDFPPLKTLNNSNLPLSADPLIGRKKELVDVLRAVREGGRLVTITGPGGIGKTRFALQVATELIEDFADGVWWIGLAAVRDHALVLPTIAASIGAKADLTDELRSKRMLLLLDNFEHVIEAAPQLAEVQRASAGVVLLVTSREPLHIAGEREHPLSPLPESPAVELFTQRAEAITPEFDADYGKLVELCDRLDRLPLAIELAAARTKLLSIDGLVERLDERLPLLTSRRRDVDERQRTLRATIEWSFDLLDVPDQTMFARLSVFAGSFDAAAAQAVCDADLDALDSLVDKSLLRRTEHGRFFMLETIREYATGLLAASSDSGPLRRRHLDYYLDLVVRMEPELAGSGQIEALAKLVLDEGNVRQALSFACDERDAEAAFMLSGSNWRFWYMRAQLAEARRWYDRAFALDGAASTRARARALYGLSEMELEGGNFDRARALLFEALPLLRAWEDTRWVVSAMNHLASAHLGAGETTAARELYEETLGLARSTGNRRAVEMVTGNLGYLAIVEGRDDDAGELLTAAEELERASGSLPGLASTLVNLALLSLRRGDDARAASRIAESLELSRSTGTDTSFFEALLLAGVVCHRRGEVQSGIQLQSAARALAVSRDYDLSAGELAVADEALASARSSLGEEAFIHARSRGEEMSLDAAVTLALESLD
jgi:predicted ATPase